MMWGYYNGGWGWWSVAGFAWMILFWGAIIWLVVWGTNRLSRRDASEKTTATEIAKMRYARGEVTKEQFEQIKKDLLS